MQKMIQGLEDENNKSVHRGVHRGERKKHLLSLTLASSMHPVSTSLRAPGASEVEPEHYQTKTRDDVIFIR